MDLYIIKTEASGTSGGLTAAGRSPAPALQRAPAAAGEGALTQLHETSHPIATCTQMYTAQLSAEHAPAVKAHTSSKPNGSA